MKKSIALILSVLMLMSVFATFAFAGDVKNYLSLGDSIAYGLSLTDRKNQVAGAIVSRTNGYNYKNDAISGHTTEMMLKRIGEKQVTQDIAQADIICISIGGNDYLMDNMPKLVAQAVKGDYENFDKIKAVYYENIGKIIDYIKGVNPDVHILFQTLYNPMYATNTVRKAYQDAVDRINGSIKEYLNAHEGAYTIVDVEKAFLDDESLVAFDYTHPNAYGQEVIAKEILKTLHELGIGENTEPVLVRKKAAFFIEDLVVKCRGILEKVFYFIKMS